MFWSWRHKYIISLIRTEWKGGRGSGSEQEREHERAIDKKQTGLKYSQLTCIFRFGFNTQVKICVNQKIILNCFAISRKIGRFSLHFLLARSRARNSICHFVGPLVGRLVCPLVTHLFFKTREQGHVNYGKIFLEINWKIKIAAISILRLIPDQNLWRSKKALNRWKMANVT